MYIVAINDLTGDKEGRAPELAAALGVTNYEAANRLRAPGIGPFVVFVSAEADRAALLAQDLAKRGFSVLTLSPEEIDVEAKQRGVRRFALDEQALRLDTVWGENHTIPYADVRLLLRGMGISSSTTMETRTERKFDIATAIASNGLKTTKTVKVKQAVTQEKREGFFNLYAAGGSVFSFFETAVVAEGLGAARALSRSANFLQLLAELRKRCPDARFDDRLLNKAGAAALLGPRLDPGQHIVVATALLAKAFIKP